MKRIVLITGVFTGIMISVIWLGYYPVASVDGSLLWQHTWMQMQKGALRGFTAEITSSGGKIPDASSPEYISFLTEIKRETLGFLVDDRILLQEGMRLADDFDSRVNEKLAGVLNNRKRAYKTAKVIYGFSSGDFRTLVLLPQARREMAAGILKTKGVSFDQWFGEAKQKKRVQLFFTGFRWEKGEVK